jgi:hypothetical protein
VPWARERNDDWNDRQSCVSLAMQSNGRSTSVAVLGGIKDNLHAANILEFISSTGGQHDARIEVARIGTRDLVEAFWSSVKAVAEKLLRNQTLDAAAVKAIVLRCDRELDSS